MPIRTRRKNKKVECRKESEPFKNGAVSFCAKSIRGAEKNGIIPVFRNKLGHYHKWFIMFIKYEKIAKIRKNEEIREIKSYYERKKENYKIHAFAK